MSDHMAYVTQVYADVAFIFRIKTMKGEENAVLLISVYVLFVTASLALLFDILKLKKES